MKTLDKLVEDTFFTVDFIKKDGSVRSMNCRQGVVKHLKNPNSPITIKRGDLVTVWSHKGYRSFHEDKVLQIRARGKVWYPVQLDGRIFYEQHPLSQFL